MTFISRYAINIFVVDEAYNMYSGRGGGTRRLHQRPVYTLAMLYRWYISFMPLMESKLNGLVFGGDEIGSTGTEGKVETTVWLPKGQSYNCQR